jgi:hypothetical protein
MWFLTLREEHRLRMSTKIVLRTNICTYQDAGKKTDEEHFG